MEKDEMIKGEKGGLRRIEIGKKLVKVEGWFL